MAAPTYIKNIAIIGASGNLGSLILKSFLSAKRFNITAITRTSSSSVFPTDGSITIQKGDYDSPSFLHAALSGQDALVLVLEYMALVQPQIRLIEAAAAAGVKWILPTEYGTDSAHEDITKAVPFNSIKVAPRLRLEELAQTHQGLKWIGVITNIWFDYGLVRGFFKINVSARTATLLDSGVGKFNTTTKITVALAVTRLLSLPEASPTAGGGTGASLSDFANGFCYVSSFLTCQKEILDAVQRISGTSAKEWTVEDVDAESYIQEGKERVAKGDFGGTVNILGGMLFKGGMGGDYESVKGVSNEVLGLPRADLDETVRDALGELVLKG